MYERFTDRARKVMALANQEAQRFNHDKVDTQHILLGLVKEGSGVAANVLRNMGVDLREIRAESEKLSPPGTEPGVVIGKLPLTPDTKLAVANAIEAAKVMRHDYVGTEHLLLGLLYHGIGATYPDGSIATTPSLALEVLHSLGLTATAVEKETLDLMGLGVRDNDAPEKEWTERALRWKTS